MLNLISKQCRPSAPRRGVRARTKEGCRPILPAPAPPLRHPDPGCTPAPAPRPLSPDPLSHDRYEPLPSPSPTPTLPQPHRLLRAGERAARRGAATGAATAGGAAGGGGGLCSRSHASMRLRSACGTLAHAT